MYFAQVMTFLTIHHHIHWVYMIAAGKMSFTFAVKWAVAHGFIYQR